MGLTEAVRDHLYRMGCLPPAPPGEPEDERPPGPGSWNACAAFRRMAAVFRVPVADACLAVDQCFRRCGPECSDRVVFFVRAGSP